MKKTRYAKSMMIFGVMLVLTLGVLVPQAEAARFWKSRPFRYRPVQRTSVPYSKSVQNPSPSFATEEVATVTEDVTAGASETGISETGASETQEAVKTQEKEDGNGDDQGEKFQLVLPFSEEETADTVSNALLQVDGLTLTEPERRVYELTNKERQARGLPPLQLSRRLVESARRQASWMAKTGVFRHGNSGYAENIAMGQPNGLSVVRDWMNSSGHKRNMMNRSYGAIGIGAYRGANGQLYWCQQFSH